MALSDRAKEALRRALTEDVAADEIEAAINSSALDPAAAVADVAQADAVGASETYVEAQAQSAIDLANANKSKLNELMASLRSGGHLDT